MERKEIGLGNPVSIAGVTLIPVVRVSLKHWHSKHGASFFGITQPVNVVVVSPSARRAFRITGEEISLDQLMQEAPGIEETLEEI